MAKSYIIFALLINTCNSIVSIDRKSDIVIQRYTPQSLYVSNKHGKYQGKIYFDTTQCSIDRLQIFQEPDKATTKALFAQAMATLKQCGCLEIVIQKDLFDLLKNNVLLQEQCSSGTAHTTIYINTTYDDAISVPSDIIITHEREDELFYKAFINDEPSAVGFAQINATSCTLNNLHVITTFQGRGIGKELFVQAMNDLGLKDCMYAYLKSLRSAVNFYKKQGAIVVKDKGLVSMKISLKKQSE